MAEIIARTFIVLNLYIHEAGYCLLRTSIVGIGTSEGLDLLRVNPNGVWVKQFRRE
jgi:hypothetical protein